MTFSLKELMALWRPALALLAAAALGWVLVSYAQENLRQTQERAATQARALQDARQRFQRSDEEKASILRYLPEYRTLQQQGFVGSENRLEWIEALRAADRKAGLDGVQFRIEPQEVFQHPAASGVIASRVRRSTMRLTLGLTHEVDLLEFLDALSAQNPGVFSVRECVLSGQPGDPAPRRANLQAECEIDWLSVSAPEAPA
jgi:type II secretory pathway pseudopilin PulG